MPTPDFSDDKETKFRYKNQYYVIFHDPVHGWRFSRFSTLWDYYRRRGFPEYVSGYYPDADSLLRTEKIGDLTLGEVLKSTTGDLTGFGSEFAYDYDKFLADISSRAEFIFHYRDQVFFIDFWTTSVPAPAWIFSTDLGRNLLISSPDFNEFIRQVDRWMQENAGKTLREMFDRCYREGNSGDLRLEMIDGREFSSGQPPG
jgi:hypothetical protein